MRLTAKQIELLAVIAAGNEDGSAVDLDQIIEKVSYHPSKDSLHFSIRALVAHKLIEKTGREKRRGRSHTLIAATDLGKRIVAAPKRSFIVSESDIVTEALLEL